VRLFLDANVLFSVALAPPDRSHLLASLAEDNRCVLVTSRLGAEEARCNLALKASHASLRVDTLLTMTVIGPDPGEVLISWASAQGLPHKDAPLLAAAVVSGADLFVTGDRRHFGHLFGRILKGVRVVRLNEAVRLIIESGQSNDTVTRGQPS
jgi:predicted nucleic acid-binding protein